MQNTKNGAVSARRRWKRFKEEVINLRLSFSKGRFHLVETKGRSIPGRWENKHTDKGIKKYSLF